MFCVISVYFNVRNILSKSGTFPPGHPVYIDDILMLSTRITEHLQKLFTTAKTQKKVSIADLIHVTNGTSPTAFVAGTLIERTRAIGIA